MNKRFLALAVLALLLALPAAAFADGPPDGRPVGPPHGAIWANDVAYQVVATPTEPLPDSAPDFTFDTLYHFPDCEGCMAVSDAAPGDTDYNGGRWIVVNAYGIDSQLTNATDVEAQATSLVATTTTLVCPLIPR